MTKREFIESEFLGSSIRGAFQRAEVYSRGSIESDPGRQQLRERLTSLLRELKTQYVRPVSERQHKENIQKIADELTKEFGKTGLLRGNRFRIGIAQRALNLFLKYLWCLEEIPTPPHCPFDETIVTQLRVGLQWTQFDSLADYQVLVDAAMKMKPTEYASLSEWELQGFDIGRGRAKAAQAGR